MSKSSAPEWHRTVRISLYTAVAAVINLVLNYIFIPYFGYVAAAYTTIVSYVVALILHTSYAKKLRPACRNCRASAGHDRSARNHPKTVGLSAA